MKITQLLPLIGFLYLALLPNTPAVVPAPDGGYPGGNTAEGQDALFSLTSGGFDTAIGFLSGRNVTTGSLNTAVGAGALAGNNADSNTATGAGALFNNTTGSSNTANGAVALFSNIDGINNTAIGFEALFSNSSGADNTAIGNFALAAAVDGSDNTATGASALASNTSGNLNTANGSQALFDNTTGVDNTAIGAFALNSNSTGSNNTAIGFNALRSSTDAVANTATGAEALADDTTGFANTATGRGALSQNTTGHGNTATGVSALIGNTTGANNVAMGAAAGANVTTAGNVICIGSNVRGANLSNTCFIGNIRGVTTFHADAIPVLIDSNDQLGTVSSSIRFKEQIRPMDTISESILALRPVTFEYKSDQTDSPQFGLIAEEVAEVNPDLIVRDKNGEIYTVRYDAVNAMLLNEFLKEHRRVEEQECALQMQGNKIQEQATTIGQLKKQIEAVLAHSKEQDQQIQRVSNEMQISSSLKRVANAE